MVPRFQFFDTKLQLGRTDLLELIERSAPGALRTLDTCKFLDVPKIVLLPASDSVGGSV